MRVRTAALVAGAAAIVGGVVGLQGQVAPLSTGRTNPQFEVAVVKSNRSSDPATSRFPLGIGDAFAPGGIFAAINQPLIAYLRFAFKISDFEALPSWVSVERYDIEGRANSTSSKDDMRLMMQGLLKERFGLRIHTERRTANGLALRVAKRAALGPNLRRANSANCASATSDDQGLIPCGRIGPSTASAPGLLRISGRSIPLSRFASFITNPVTGIDRPVFDQTELAGLFDFDLEWTGDAESRSDLAGTAELTFVEALNDQLGLKLVRSKGTLDVLKVDRIERPTSD
jgi:uncharacterized protein (TIGR03435 family)